MYSIFYTLKALIWSLILLLMMMYLPPGAGKAEKLQVAAEGGHFAHGCGARSRGALRITLFEPRSYQTPHLQCPSCKFAHHTVRELISEAFCGCACRVSALWNGLPQDSFSLG